MAMLFLVVNCSVAIVVALSAAGVVAPDRHTCGFVFPARTHAGVTAVLLALSLVLCIITVVILVALQMHRSTALCHLAGIEAFFFKLHLTVLGLVACVKARLLGFAGQRAVMALHVALVTTLAEP